MGGYSNLNSISNLLTLIGKRLDLVMVSDSLLYSLGRLMNTQIGSIFEDGSSEMIRNRYWYILSELIEKLEPAKFFEQFTSVVVSVLHSTTY